MKKVIVATLVAALEASAWADFTKVQESFEDNGEIVWTYSDDGYWSSTDSAASENITTVAYGENEGYAYDETEGAENVPAVEGWPGDKYLNLAKATNLSRNFVKDGTVDVLNDGGYVLDTLVSFTATEAEDAPTPATSDKFLIWLEETELEPVTAEDGTISYPTLTNLIIKCGNDAATSTNDFTLVTTSGTLPVKVGEWARVSVKAIPLYSDGPLGFVVYINGAAVMAGESDETYKALFTKTDSTLTDSAKGYYELKQIFPSLTSGNTLTAVDFKGTGKIDDFQLVAAADQPAFIVTPIVVTIKGFGTIPEDWSDAIIVEGNEISEAPETPEVKGYKFIGWYTVDENGNYVEAKFPLEVTASTILYAKFENADVAMIGETAYGTFQDAINAAVETATAASPVQIDIARDFTIDKTITLLGKGKDVTKITINNEKWTVTFNTQATAGFTIDDATVTFEGEGGIWNNPFKSYLKDDGKTWVFAKTSFCVGEAGKTENEVKTLAPADVIVNSGTYTSYDSHVFNVACGSATVNGGSFKVENYSKKFCFRAEKSDIDAENATATLTVKGGTFEIPSDSDGLPVGNKKKHTHATTKILATGTAKFKCNKKCIAGGLSDYNTLGSYLVTESEEGGYVTTSDYAFTLDPEGYYYAAPKVVTIGEVGYASLQDAIDEAIEASTAENEVTIDIVKDITITDTVSLTGKGMDATKIVLNANEGVTVVFNMTTAGNRGFTIDNATVTFKGKGSWSHETDVTQNNEKTAFCIGEMGVTNEVGVVSLAPAYVTIEEGSFSSKKAHVFNVQNGMIKVNGGNFKTSQNGKCCIRAENSEVKDSSKTVISGGSALLVVAGGIFETPVDKDNTCAPVGTAKYEGYEEDKEPQSEVHILVSGTAKFKCNEVCFTDNAKLQSMNRYLSVEGTDTEGNTTYTHTDDYKFVKGEDEYWTIKEITKAKLTVDWTEGKVVSFKLSDDEETIETEGKTSCSIEDYDVDDASEVSVVTGDIVFSTGWMLDEEKSTLGPVTMTEDRTLYIAAKLKYSPVDPEATSSTYTDKTEADDLADAINSNKVDMITAPDISAATFYKSDYVALFEAKVVGDTTSGYTVSVVLTEDAKTKIEEEVNKVFTAESLDLSKIATAGASFTATVTPGLYYTVLSGTDVKEITSMSTPVLAESTQVKLTLPKKDGNCGFYRIQVDVKKPTTSAQ